MDVARAVGAYIKLRDLKTEVKARHTAELAPINEKMTKLEAMLLNHLTTQNTESVRTSAGTAYKSTRTSAKVIDWDACLAFIREHNFWHLLERRVAKTAIEEIVAGSGELPPGVDLSSEVTINIRIS